MGKVQSKRSVDITTEVCKDGVIEEGTGKMGKIEDVDQLKAQVNGDTQHTDAEITDKEKKVESENENEKDIATEKEQNISIPISPEEKPIEPAQIAGDGGDDLVNKTLENGNDETLNESKITEAGTPAPAENGESNKKPKKEKVKKKWSFRSLSFSKKDKQKPDKKNKEEATNGEIEKVPEETNEETAAVAPVTTEPAPATEPATEASGTETITKIETVETTITTTIETEKTVEKVANESIPEAPVTIVENGTSSEVKPEPEPVPVASPAKVEIEPTPVAVIEEKEPAPVVAEVTKVEEVKNEAEPAQQQTEAVVEIKEEVKSEEIKPEEKKDVEPVIAIVEVMPCNDQANKIETNEEDLSKNKSDVEIEVVTNEVKSTDNVEVGDSTIPPPLPTIPPPSQVMVFAVTAMATNEINTPCPISTQSDSVLVDNETKVQDIIVEAAEKKVDDIPAALDAVVTPVLDIVENVVEPATVADDKLPEVEAAIVEEVVAKAESSTPVECVAPLAVEAPLEVNTEQKIEEPIPDTITVEALIEPISEIAQTIDAESIKEIENAVPPQSEIESPTLITDIVTQETLEEQIAIIDKVMDAATESSEVETTSIDDLSSLPPPPPMPNTDAANEDDKITDLSVEVSSPLPQNSLDSLPSPPMSSLSPSDVSLPPPPPESPTAVNTPATDNVTTNEQKQDIVTETQDATLPPPVSEEIVEAAIITETEIIPPTETLATEATETDIVNKPEGKENDETVLNTPSLEKAIDEAVDVTVSAPPAEPIAESITSIESSIETVVEEIKPKLNGCSNEEDETKIIVENNKAEQKIEENGHQNGHAEVENLAAEKSATESVNGDLDHSKVEEPIKEKLSTVIPPQEAVTAE